MCPHDNFVTFLNSELICGVIDKAMIGATDNKRNIFYVILKDYGKKAAADAMFRAGKIAIEFLMNRGFSIGLGDLTPSEKVLSEKDKLVRTGYSKVADSIKLYEDGQIQCDPGRNAEETLEAKALSTLSEIRTQAGNELTPELNYGNSTQIMTQCGSKGSTINMCQMMACVGQQAISGNRIPDGFGQRSLPHFKIKSKLPEAKGFVGNSFYSGMMPTEMFFHTMGGREGLVDTAVKTAETGYMQRRLVKCLEDLHVAADGTVRNCEGMVMQWVFGEDGLDPACIETSSSGDPNKINPPTDLERIYEHIRKSVKKKSFYCLEMVAATKRYFNGLNIEKLTEMYIQQIVSFIQTQEDKVFEILETLPSRKRDLIRRDLIRHEFCQVDESLGKRLQDKELTDDQFNELMLESQEKILESKMSTASIYNFRQAVITEAQIIEFLHVCVGRYVGTKTQLGVTMPYGSLVGATCAQCIGEPATQMTLKTFHFAGVASMDVTQGVPRINEIINATKEISTPVITAQLLDSTNKEKAHECKARIEKTLLGDIVEKMKWVGGKDCQKFVIKLDAKRINALKLRINIHTVKDSIVAMRTKLNLNVTDRQVVVRSQTILEILQDVSGKAKDADFSLQLRKIERRIEQVPVSGLATVSRAVIYERDKNYVWRDLEIKRTARPKAMGNLLKPLNICRENGSEMNGEKMEVDQPTCNGAVAVKEEKSGGAGKVYQLCVEGNNLRDIMATYGVDGVRVTSNNIMEVYQVLGIEAARGTIITELNKTLAHHGLSVDPRHVSLLANRMTCHGLVTGVNRHGLAKTCNKVFTMASFEQTTDHLYQAAYHGEANAVTGVSDSIIAGKAMPMGTGMVSLMTAHRGAAQRSHAASASATARYEALCTAPPVPPPRRWLFDRPELRVPL